MCLCSLGSFLLKDMFLNLPAFAFEGQHKKLTVNMLLTCILYCDARPSCLIRTVCKYSMLILYHGYHILSSYVFLRRRCSLTSRKLYDCLQTFIHVSLHLCGRAYVARCKKKCSSVFLRNRLCRLFCELCMPLIG